MVDTLYDPIPNKATASMLTTIPLLLALLAPPATSTPSLPASVDQEAAALAEAVAALPPVGEQEDWAAAAITIRDRARAFSAKYPTDLRGLEIDTSISVAIEDDEGVNAAFSQVMAIAPEMTGAGLAWVNYWTPRDSAQAIDILSMLLDDMPGSRLYMDRLFKLMDATEPDRLTARFAAFLQPESNREQARLELDQLARTAPSYAARFGEQLHAAFPDDLELTVATARALRQSNRFSQAKQLMQSVPESSFTDPSQLYLWSDVHFANHEFDRAVEILNRIDMDAIHDANRIGLHRRLKFVKPIRSQAVEEWPAELQKRSDDALRDDNPLAIIRIGGREVLVELFENDSPNTVANFIASADLGLYDQYPAGQVQTGFRSIMGGRHDDDGAPAWTIPDEHETTESRAIGAGSLVSYRISRPKATTGEFFILHFPAIHLNGKRTTFGRVLTGLDVIREMQEGDVIDSVKVIRRRPQEYDPVIYNEDGEEISLKQLLNQ
jgi:peptidyl-prolyl cis-trans isomerase B (cyclophilin B)